MIMKSGEQPYDETQMYTYIKNYAQRYGLLQTQKALPFAREHHAGQVRKGSGSVPYIAHPLNMACHALALGLVEDDLLAVILLHDVSEDCAVPPEELPVGKAVQNAVRLLTFHVQSGETKAEARARYFAALAGNREAVLTKLLDRCNNVSFMVWGFPPQKLRSYIDETRMHILPLLAEAKRQYPECSIALYLIEYHLCSVLGSIDVLLAGRNFK